MVSVVFVHHGLLAHPLGTKPRLAARRLHIVPVAPLDLWEERGDEQPWAHLWSPTPSTAWAREDTPTARAEAVARAIDRHRDRFRSPDESSGGPSYRGVAWVDLGVPDDGPLLDADLPVPHVVLGWDIDRDPGFAIPTALDALTALGAVA